MSKQRTSDNGIRYALVPHPGCVCEQCLQIASYGFHYKDTGWSPHKTKNIKCECQFIAGIDGLTRVDGYDIGEVRGRLSSVREANAVIDESIRVSNKDAADAIVSSYVDGGVLISAEVMDDKLYSLSRSEIVDEEKRLDKLLGRLYESDSRKYGPYRSFIESYSKDGIITIDDGVKLKAKELQAASWVRKLFSSLHFRNANLYNSSGGNTSDLLADGECWDIKRIESKNKNKIWARIHEKPTQGPNFIIDLSIGEMTLQDAFSESCNVIGRGLAEKIIIIKDKKAYMLRNG